MAVVIIQAGVEGGSFRQNKWLCMFPNSPKVLMNHQSPPAINVFQILQRPLIIVSCNASPCLCSFFKKGHTKDNQRY